MNDEYSRRPSIDRLDSPQVICVPTGWIGIFFSYTFRYPQHFHHNYMYNYPHCVASLHSNHCVVSSCDSEHRFMKNEKHNGTCIFHGKKTKTHPVQAHKQRFDYSNNHYAHATDTWTFPSIFIDHLRRCTKCHHSRGLNILCIERRAIIIGMPI